MKTEMTDNQTYNDTICAPATPNGTSALGIIRVSGQRAIAIINELFATSAGQKQVITDSEHARAKRGYIVDENNKTIDEVLCTAFFSPKSYTGENLVEISHHGSPYIQQQIMQALLSHGARVAGAGEFSQRAFLNGKMDLAHAEAITDLINAKSAAAHALAIQQLRGGYREKIESVRSELVRLLSLLELELDFSEEDVEFANRETLKAIMGETIGELEKLVRSFKAGNAFKNGIPIAIIGKPNSGKSTLLNEILQEERAIVSPVSGTTRDTIEESLQIEGVEYRFIDSAGIRATSDQIESQGIERSLKAAEKADVIIYVCDLSTSPIEQVRSELSALDTQISLREKEIIIAANKSDLTDLSNEDLEAWKSMDAVVMSAANHAGVEELLSKLADITVKGNKNDEILVSNARHYDAMQRTLESILVAEQNLQADYPTDLIAADIRQATHYMGEISGEISTSEVLNSIFSEFCIGK